MYIENVKIVSLQDLLDELKDKKFVRDSILKNFKIIIIKIQKTFYITKQQNLKRQVYQAHIQFLAMILFYWVIFLWQISLCLYRKEIMRHYRKAKEKNSVKMAKD